MTNKDKAKITLDSLIEQYNEWALSIQNNPKQLQGVHLSTEYGYVYIRNMARGVIFGEPVVCLATIDFVPEIQSEGVLSALIKHIENNPFAFTELEVENVMVDYLVNSLIKNDFEKTLFNPDFPLPVTMLKKL